MDALQTLLRPAAAMINRQIALKTPARALCRGLAGRVMAVRVRHTSLAMYLAVRNEQLDLASSCDTDPDVVICGSLVSLAGLATPAGEDLIRRGALDIDGDALIAQQFQKLLRYGRPDLEEELSAYVGDIAAHGIGEFVRVSGNWARQTRTTMRQNIGEYLQEESRVVPARHESANFRDDVNALRDDVARFEARLRKFEQERA